MVKYFFDAHMHAMNLTHPNFVSFVDGIADSIGEFVTSGALSPGYLLTPANRKQQGLTTLINMFSLFEKSIGQIFSTMEEDLKGDYHERKEGPYPKEPYLRDNKIHFRSKTYEKFALIPLVVDFSRVSDEDENKAYYTIEKQQKIVSYLNETIRGIKNYYTHNPKGLLEFFPFLGINPEIHSQEFIEMLIETYMDHNSQDENKKDLYKGIKLYPPLGTNPWPSDKSKLAKINLIYKWCEENNIPIITHCDDQGFRGVSAKLAQQYTNPESWEIVLKHYPTLKIDFAHYGRQYKTSIKKVFERSYTEDPWFNKIIELMIKYENVYADFSFSGTEISFYNNLNGFINKLKDDDKERVLKRSLFGSDFMINLAKVESYSNYLSIFENSDFDDEAVDLFVSENPMRFLNLS
ncbi:MAG: amidohydrolase family protein [Sphaerochaetaceae bacterium]|jgi:hypothetical protein